VRLSVALANKDLVWGRTAARKTLGVMRQDRMKMKYFDYNPFGPESLTLEFTCDKCGHSINTDDIPIPLPNFSAETSRDSTEEYEESVICEHENCGSQYDITLYSSFGGGQGEISNLDDEQRISITENYGMDYELEAILSNSEFKLTFDKAIEKIGSLNEIDVTDAEQNTLLKNLLFVNIVSAMETYMSDAFINVIDKKDEKYLRQFVGFHKKYNEEKIKLSEIFSSYDNLKARAINDLKEISFHSIENTRPLYERALQVQFPRDLSRLAKIIEQRHDIVHRNGKTKENIPVAMTFEEIQYTIAEIDTFVNFIDNQIIRL
jgi:hypothetical protein